MSRYFKVKNFDRFQHYKDRSPPWIKLYNELLDDYEFCQLSDASKAHLLLIWLLASRSDNQIPWDEKWIANKISAGSEIDLDELCAAGFIFEFDPPAKAEPVAPSTAEGWGSRYISRQVKGAVWKRDGGKCTACGATSFLEYDHVTPVSAGGSSEADNIQLLCRSCNRRKRVRSTSYVDAEQVATQQAAEAQPRERNTNLPEKEVEKKDSTSTTLRARVFKSLGEPEGFFEEGELNSIALKFPHADHEARLKSFWPWGVRQEKTPTEIKAMYVTTMKNEHGSTALSESKRDPPSVTVSSAVANSRLARAEDRRTRAA